MRKKRILIVEDEALVAENLREFIEKAGFIVVGVLSTGEEAIQAIGEELVDLVLMDIRLAGEINGIDTMNIIHQTKEIPVVFLSAYADDQFFGISKISPMLYRYIAKPYKEDELESLIKELLH